MGHSHNFIPPNERNKENVLEYLTSGFVTGVVATIAIFKLFNK